MKIVVVLLVFAFGLARGQQCGLANLSDRVDCYPDKGVNEQNCRARGCCWQSATPIAAEELSYGSTLNVPWCFYPTDYDGYRVLNETKNEKGTFVYLQRGRPSNIAKDIEVLRVEVIPQNDNTVRIRIVDANQQRWEPPIPALPSPASKIQPTYSVSVTEDRKLEVYRFNGVRETTKLASFDLGSMVFTDTFLQLTNRLSSETLYGLGEHKGSLKKNMKYTRLTYYNEDRPPVYNARVYGVHPLYINIENDGNANGVWLLNSNAMDIILLPTPAVVYRPVGGIFDFYVFTGPSPSEIVKQYQGIVGLPKMIPYWSLGYHLCRFGYESTEDTRQTLQRNLDAGVRVDVQWNDIDYMDRRNGFTLDPKNYADLGKLVDEIHSQGRHYVMIVDPAVSGSEPRGQYPPFDKGEEYDVFVKDINNKVAYARVWNLQSSVFPDFTHPNITAYWTELYQNFYKEVAYDGTWIDMNEPANMLDGHVDEGCPHDFRIPYTPGDEPLQTKTLCLTDKHHWSSHYNVHNLYGITEAVATYEAMKTVRPNKRPFIISRSSFSGLGHFAGHWTGDIFSTWTDLKDSIPGILEFSFYGIPMVGADICGFLQETNAELCARWQAVGAFYPFSRNHNTENTKPQDPAAMGGKVLTVTKNAYYWRYKLLPFLYTLFYRAHVDGDTVARPLFFEYPHDPNTYAIDEQFMWGSALMVVPALHENQQQIQAYFPAGIWYNVQNTTKHFDTRAGGRYIQVPAFDDSINFFMKGGNAVFFQEPGLTTTDSRKNPFGLYVFLEDRSAKGELYVDDGESIDAIEKENFTLVNAMASDNVLVISTESGKDTAEKLDTIHFYGVEQEPTAVDMNNVTISNIHYDSDRQLLSLYGLNASMKMITVSIRH